MSFFKFSQFGSVIPDNLWSAMQSALNDQSYVPHEGFKIKTVMDTWINQNRYPVLNVIRNYETGEVTITQQCFYTTNDKCMNSTWWIPITFATQSNPDFSKTVPNHWMGSNQTRIPEVHSSDWIIVNVQQTGMKQYNNIYLSYSFYHHESFTSFSFICTLLFKKKLIKEIYI